MRTLTPRELREISRANDSEATPVVFVHGLWLLASSWDPWRARFEDEGYATLAPGWPDEPPTVGEARARPEAFAGKGVQEVTDHFAEVLQALHTRAVLIGHSVGGLIVQKLAGMGLAGATVAIDPAPFRGVLPLPLSTLRAVWWVLGKPSNRRRALSMTFAQFRFAFANAISEGEARTLYDNFTVPAPARPLFQAAMANLHRATEARVDTLNRWRGPLLLISGERDTIVPRALVRAAYARQRRNPDVTEFRELPHRGHSLVFDHGWREVAAVALSFARRLGPARALVDHTPAIRLPDAGTQPEARP